MDEDTFEHASAIQAAVHRDTSRYFSLMEAELFWAAFKQAMIQWEKRNPSLPAPYYMDGTPLTRAAE